MNQDLMVFIEKTICLKNKRGAYEINLDEIADVGTHCICFIFGVEHVPEEIKEFIRNKNIIANIFRAQANSSMI